MKQLSAQEMEEFIAGTHGWCVAAGFVTAMALGTGPIGWLMFGPSAGALIAVCILC